MVPFSSLRLGLFGKDLLLPRPAHPFEGDYYINKSRFPMDINSRVLVDGE